MSILSFYSSRPWINVSLLEVPNSFLNFCLVQQEGKKSIIIQQALFCRSHVGSAGSDEVRIRSRCLSDGDVDTRTANEVRLILDSFRSAPATPVFSEDESVFNSPENDSEKADEADNGNSQKNDSSSVLSRTTSNSNDLDAIHLRDDIVNEKVEKRKISSASDSSTSSKRMKTEQFANSPSARAQCSIDEISNPKHTSSGLRLPYVRSLSREYERIAAPRSNSTSSSIALVPSNNLASNEAREGPGKIGSKFL